MKKLPTLAALLRLSPLLMAWPAAAQEMALAPADVLTAEVATPMADTRFFFADDDNVAFAAGELRRERVVKGAPYCADAVQESVQPLADGNRIVHRQSTRLCRDGEGRTRQEVEHGGHKIVYLRDPVSKENWVLDPARKSARRLGSHFAPQAHDSAAWREYGDRMREWAKSFREQLHKDVGAAPTPPTPPMPPTPGAAPAVPVVITQDERETRDASGKPRKEVQVQVLRIDGSNAPVALPAIPALPPVPPIAPMPPGIVLHTQLGAPRGPGVASPLGSKDIEGVKANGERTTWTIEAGKVGNEKPIVITRDVWTSPELMLTVLSRDADPRVGETTYRLANLKRGEPDAALMRVPADYATSRGVTPTPNASAAKG